MRAKGGLPTPGGRRPRSERSGTARRSQAEPARASRKQTTVDTAASLAHLPKRETNALRNRAAILTAAREIFSELGYGAATIRDIIRRTDLAAGTFYNYFPDKESVLRELIKDFTRRTRARVRQSRMEARTLEELLRSSFLTCFRLYAEETTLVEMMARNVGELSLLTSGAILEPAVEELVADLRSKEIDGIIPHVDNERLARAAVALATELGLHMLARRPVDIVGTTEFATQLMLGGIERLAGGARAGGSSKPGQPQGLPLRSA